jgi:membrane fusion protein (multidrug efflux system)
MKAGGTGGSWPLLLLLLLVVDTASCERAAEPATEFADAAPALGRPIEVETARIRRGSIVQRISAPSSIVARREAHIGTEVRGRILEIFVREGDRVAANAPLFQIDPEPYVLALRQSEAALDRVRAERSQKEADLGRARLLRSQNIVAEQEADRISTELDIARAHAREAGEAVALSKRNLERTLIRAPFDGSITRRWVDEGTTALVQPQTIVLVLQEIGVLEAVATIAETHFASVRVGDVVLLHVDGLPLPIQTELSAVGDAVDPGSRTFRVKMPVSDPEHLVKAGLFARAEILPQAKSQVLLAPREALRSQDGSTQVLVVRDGIATLATIEVGLISENAIEVLAGLREDDEVVVGDAARSLAHGMRVQVSNARADAG